MGLFADAVRERVRQARSRLAAALDIEDVYAADLAQEELEDALWVAARHNISTESTDGVSEQ
ncbi:hypothetical protein ABZ883_43030 [Streptomyces sp. NPDC046977]|uniref:hypothetical protein n=1 Tax=Streptomyces sp. NPDC046977 TaxID=3154703 RepID=UPI0033FB4F89